MLLAARNIVTFVEGITKDLFLSDIEKQYAVLHAIEIIGEAASHVSDETKSQFDQIPWRDIRGMRNRLAHEYFAVDLHIVWDTVVCDIEPLIQAMEKSVREDTERDHEIL